MLKELLENFFEYLKYERGYSNHTIKSYRRDLYQFIAFLEDHLKRELLRGEDVDHYHIRAYLSSLYASHAKTSIARKLAAIRSFFKYLMKRGHLDSNPADLIFGLKLEKKAPVFFTVDEAYALMDAPDTSNVLGLRNRAILELFYSSGLRIAELAGLNRDDVDFASGLTRVTGKGSKERVVPGGIEGGRGPESVHDQDAGTASPRGGGGSESPVSQQERNQAFHTKHCPRGR